MLEIYTILNQSDEWAETIENSPIQFKDIMIIGMVLLIIISIIFLKKRGKDENYT